MPARSTTSVVIAGLCLTIARLGAQTPRGRIQTDSLPPACNTNNETSRYYRDQLAAKTALLKRQADARAASAKSPKSRGAALEDSRRLAAELEVLALQPRITVVGGTPDTTGGFLSQVAFITASAASGSPSLYACGVAGSGTLIRADWIVTAAHVVCGPASPGTKATPIDKTSLRVLAGSETLSAAGTPRTIANIFCYPTYTTGPAQIDDIALVRLDSPVAGATLASYVTDQTTESQILGATNNATVTGWGATSYGGNESDQLLVGLVNQVTYSDCNSAYVGNPITGNMMCAGDTTSTHCSGDSGGPLWMQGAGGALQQIAIVSSTPDTGCLVNKPGVYTRIVPYYACFVQPTLDSGSLKPCKTTGPRKERQ